MRSLASAFLFFLASGWSVEGRLYVVKPMEKLMEEAALVVVGEVRSVVPSGITTELAYPTWEGHTFEWLRVRVFVMASIKGGKEGKEIETLMLSLRPGGGLRDENGRPIGIGMYSPPSMVKPMQGDRFLMHLLPTTEKGTYAALTAPMDETQSIFLLGNDAPDFSVLPGPDLFGRRRLQWKLLDEKGELLSERILELKARFAKEIKARPPKDAVIHLRYRKMVTSPSGWFRNAPVVDEKDVEPARKPKGFDERKAKSPESAGSLAPSILGR